MREELVFLDIETAAIEQTRFIIQLAAIAVGDDLSELETIELKLFFDNRHADQRTLQTKSRYSQAVWEKEGIGELIGARVFAEFLRRHATFDMLPSGGKRPYRLAQLVAHNGAFDGPILHGWYRQLSSFCPARYQVLCTLQRALWYFYEHKDETPPRDFKLFTLCEYFRVPFSQDEAHDALADVRATVALYRALSRRSRASQ